ncbi:AMP-dependent synthetase/ligase [Halostella salina]|uniref:AMP-dependent synthetase/ligase n=1 Tax=Halostella salina TaxID=1547897 RepID=UPI000EF7D073|nr:long-chain fatty acid--CoA ligase [Halostella salina]
MAWQEAEREYTDEVIGETPLPRAFEDAVERHGAKPAQQYKGGIYDRALVGTAVDAAPDGEYATITYDEMRGIVARLAAGFRALGVDGGDRVGMFAATRMEWAQCDLALLSAGAAVTTVYKSSSPDQVRYLLDDPGASGVVVENEELLERVLSVSDALDLRFAIVMDDVGEEYADEDGVYTLDEVYEQGAERFDEDDYASWIDDLEPDDLASLVYTSGTTGQPKGVQLTHRNLRANVNQLRKRYGPRPDKPNSMAVMDAGTTTVSYLPLAHIFERTTGHFYPFSSGGCVAYAESPDTLKEDFKTVEPDGATSVPRVYEKIYDAIREQASESDFKQRIFEWATDVSRAYYRADRPGYGLRAKLWLADKLVFSDVKAALGGNIEWLSSGGGTLSEELCTLYHGMGLPIYEGYGLTEAAPVVSTNPIEEPKLGTIGPPLPGVEVKIDKTVVPESEFTDALGDVGELLVRGPNVTEGYWNKPEETAAAFVDAEDGGDPWFRTGDIVQQRPDDYLVFRERAKQIVVLSTGKNVAPTPIEDAFAASDVIEQVMVTGDGEKFIGALVVPNFEALRAAAEAEGVDVPETPAAMCEHDGVREVIEAEVEAVNERFEPHERIKQFRLVPEEFTEDNDLLTPSMKKKRGHIRERYQHLVDDIYGADGAADERTPEAAD